MSKAQVDFAAINEAALPLLSSLLNRWCPDGRIEGSEYIALNPTRADDHLGSFKINLHTGRWADFAVGHQGGDVVSLAAYLAGTGQIEAACSLAKMLEVGHD